jgi:exodeoxyribonuclease VII large subunit
MANELPTFSVSGFTALVNQTLDYAYPIVEIEGEVASFKVNQGKFIFFDLKDEQSSVGCFMMLFALRQPIEDGMKVVIRARPKLTNWGKFSLTVEQIRPSGEGSLKKSYDLLKAKLEKEGLFALDRKRMLPPTPSRVGVISSTQAAGYGDFIKILGDRWGGMQVQVAHTQVQGEKAADQIIKALEYFNEQETLPEVIVIIRGGGSKDDLAAFNDEQLVRAVAASRVPVLAGIGHEADESLVDLAADVRASTPSNAAQILVPDRREIIRAAHQRTHSIGMQIVQAIDTHREQTRTQLEMAFSRVSERLDDAFTRLGVLRLAVSQLDPDTVLRRGYAMVRGEIKVGASLEIETDRAILEAEVKHVRKK